MDRKNPMPKIKEDSKKRNLFIQIPNELHHKLKLHCVKNDVLIKDFVTPLLEQSLNVAALRTKNK